MNSDYFDDWGWHTTDPAFAGRNAGVAPATLPAARVPGQPFPNWTGYAWVMQDYVEPIELGPVTEPVEPEPEWAWYMDPPSFTDRLGPAVVFVIDTSNDPVFIAIRNDFSRRNWIDLKDPRVAGTVSFLAGAAVPGYGQLPQPLMTPEQAQEVLTTPVPLKDNLATRKLFFGA